jgi:hypothetical protein
MIRFLVGVAVGVFAANAMQQRQGRASAGSAKPQTVGHVDELSTAAAQAGSAASGINAGDGTGGSRANWESDPVSQAGQASGRSFRQGGTESSAGSERSGEPRRGTGSENFNGS